MNEEIKPLFDIASIMTVLGAFKEPGNALGDATPRVEIIWKQHVDAFPTVGVSAG